jgi:hypothetical protein
MHPCAQSYEAADTSAYSDESWRHAACRMGATVVCATAGLADVASCTGAVMCVWLGRGIVTHSLTTRVALPTRIRADDQRPYVCSDAEACSHCGPVVGVAQGGAVGVESKALCCQSLLSCWGRGCA